MYDNNNLEEMNSYNYLGIDIHHKINCKYSIEIGLVESGKLILAFKRIANQQTFGYETKRNSSLRLSSLMLSYMVVTFKAVAFIVENHGGRSSDP